MVGEKMNFKFVYNYLSKNLKVYAYMSVCGEDWPLRYYVQFYVLLRILKLNNFYFKIKMC